MSARPIEAQVLEVLRDLSPTRQAELLDFALVLREREQRRGAPTDASLSVVQSEDIILPTFKFRLGKGILPL